MKTTDLAGPRFLPYPSRLPPYRSRREVGSDEARCLNCWAFEEAPKPIKLGETDLGEVKTRPEIGEEDVKAIEEFVGQLGFCTFHPPIPGILGLPTQPTTHPSFRCGHFSGRVAVQQRLQQQAAAGPQPMQQAGSPPGSTAVPTPTAKAAAGPRKK